MTDSTEYFGMDFGQAKDRSTVTYHCSDIDSASTLIAHLEQAKLHLPFFDLYVYYVQYPGGLWRIN